MEDADTPAYRRELQHQPSSRRQLAVSSSVPPASFSPPRERLAALVLDSAHDFAMITSDLSGHVTGWNPGAEKLLGWSEAEALGMDACEIFTPEDNADDLCQREMRTARENERAEDERFHRRKDGSRFWASGLMMLLEDGPGGEHIGYLKVLRDRTPQYEAEQRLRRLDARHREMLDGLDVGFAVIELIFDGETPADYRFVETNRAFVDQTGLVDAVGRTARDLVPGLEQSWFDLYGRVAKTGEAIRFEQGSEAMGRWFDVHALRIGEADECKVALFFNDISGRRRAENLLTLEVEQQRISLQQMPGFVAALSGPDHVFSYVNDAYLDVVGRADVLGRTVREALPELAGQGFYGCCQVGGYAPRVGSRCDPARTKC